MRWRLVSAAVLITCICSSAAAQTNAPNLTRQQKAHLEQLISAVDRAALLAPAPPSSEWLTHVLRASDGSHYVAFSFAPPPEELPPTPIVIYVRLATANVPGETTVLERSVVRDWLQ